MMEWSERFSGLDEEDLMDLDYAVAKITRIFGKLD